MWLRGRDNTQRRCLLHMNGFSPGHPMRVKTGHGAPKGWADAWLAITWTESSLSEAFLAIVLAVEGEARQVVTVAAMFGGH